MRVQHMTEAVSSLLTGKCSDEVRILNFKTMTHFINGPIVWEVDSVEIVQVGLFAVVGRRLKPWGIHGL